MGLRNERQEQKPLTALVVQLPHVMPAPQDRGHGGMALGSCLRSRIAIDGSIRNSTRGAPMTVGLTETNPSPVTDTRGKYGPRHLALFFGGGVAFRHHCVNRREKQKNQANPALP